RRAGGRPPHEITDRGRRGGATLGADRMSQSLRVFIVEDDDTTRDCLREALEGEPGFEVAGLASSLEEGRGAASVAGVEVVIVDLALGDQSGIDLIRELRE